MLCQAHVVDSQLIGDPLAKQMNLHFLTHVLPLKQVRLFDPATRLPLLTLGGFLNASDHITGSQYRIHLHPPGLTDPSAVPEGALVAVYPRRGVTVQLSNSSGVLVEDVTIHAGGNMGFHEQFGEGGNVYRRVAIVRKPGWSGLLALNADGFHSSDVGTGPTLEDSTISFTGDDFVNVHNKVGTKEGKRERMNA